MESRKPVIDFMKIIHILFFCFIISGCMRKSNLDIIVEYSKEENIEKRLYIFAELKKNRVDISDLYRAFQATRKREERIRLLDLAFALDDGIVFRMLRDFELSKLTRREIDSILIIERGDEILLIEKSTGLTLRSELDQESFQILKSSVFMSKYSRVDGVGPK